MNQDQIFSSGEGDAWFGRNLANSTTLEQAAKSEDVVFICETLYPFQEKISSILEIGCSNGLKLENICHKLGSAGVGVDPSTTAIESGNARKKIANITLRFGVGSDLPCATSEFDLVHFAFCLYLFDRSTLLRALAEGDRVLKQGGFLVITDFDPGSKFKNKYVHHDDIFSYKQDYASIYLQSGLYYMMGKKCFSHRRTYFDEYADERISTTILFKESNPYPVYR